MSVPRMSSILFELDFDGWAREQRASTDDPLVPLPGVLPRPPGHPTPRSKRRRSRDRGSHAPPRGGGPPTPGTTTGARSGGSGGTGGARAVAPTPSSRALLRPTGQPDALASRPRCQALDLPTPPAWSTPYRRGDHCPRGPLGEGEPDLGISSHPRRARHHGRHDRPIQRLGDTETPRCRPIATAVGTDLGGVPRCTSQGSDRVRLLPRRHGAPPSALRARLHPPRQPSRTNRRNHHHAGRRLGHPAGSKPLDAARRRGTCGQVPHPRSRYEVHQLLRRRLRRRRHQDHQVPSSSTAPTPSASV